MTTPTHEYSFERYLNVRGAHSPSLGPNGDRLAVLTNTTGVNQVWGLDGPGACPEQLTFFDEPIRFVSWSPTREEFAFGVDDGGDGRTQIYTHRTSTGVTTNHTAAPDAKHGWGGWNGDGSQFAFTSNRRDSSTFDVYVQDRAAAGPDAAERVYEDAGWVSVAGWSPDDRRLLLSESDATGGDLFELDVERGTRRRLIDRGDDVRYRSPNWGPDGRSIYLVTDDGSDTLYFGRLDTESKSVTVVESGGDWNVEGVGLDASGRFAYARNVEGYTDVTTGELTGDDEYRTFPEPDLPDGVYGQMRVAPDADRFALTVAARDLPPTVYVVEFETGRARPWTTPSTAQIPRETFVSPEIIRYESVDGRSIPALFSMPEGAIGSTPVIVDLHDGPESQRRPEFLARIQYFLNRGFAVFEPNVRGSTGYGTEFARLDDGANRRDAIADVVAGVDWLRENRPIDSDAIVAYGFSYGGFAALASVVEAPGRWAGCICMSGLFDLPSFLENTADWRRDAREQEYGSLDDDRELLESLSPINRVGRVECPVLVIHGENDPVVPVEQAHELERRAEEVDVPVETLIFEDEGHGVSKHDNRANAYREIVSFLESALGT